MARRKKRKSDFLLINLFEFQIKLKVLSFDKKILKIGDKFYLNFHAISALRRWRKRMCKTEYYRRKEYSSLIFHEFRRKSFVMMRLTVSTLTLLNMKKRCEEIFFKGFYTNLECKSKLRNNRNGRDENNVNRNDVYRNYLDEFVYGKKNQTSTYSGSTYKSGSAYPKGPLLGYDERRSEKNVAKRKEMEDEDERDVNASRLLSYPHTPGWSLFASEELNTTQNKRSTYPRGLLELGLQSTFSVTRSQRGRAGEIGRDGEKSRSSSRSRPRHSLSFPSAKSHQHHH